MRIMRRMLKAFFLVFPLMACGGSEPKPPVRSSPVAVGRLQSDHKDEFKPTLAINPKAVTLAAGVTQSFSAQINYEPNGPRYPRQPVKFTVLETSGGTITRTGLYTAPTAPGTYHVKAEREDHPGVADTATITVEAPVAQSKTS